MIWPFRPRPVLDTAQLARRDALKTLPRAVLNRPFTETGWCVVDVETGGLDVTRDPLLAIGAVAVRGGHIVLNTPFEVGLAQARATDTANILIHGIGDQAQREGAPPANALLDWLEFAGNYPRVAFHAGFDQAVLHRDSRALLGLDAPAPWFDAAVIAPLLFPDDAPRCRHLDDWLARFGLAAYARHGALADAYVTAELWLILLDALGHAGITTPLQLQKTLRARRWLMAN